MVDPLNVPGNVKALEKDVFKELPKEFLKTWSEWASDNLEQIKISAQSVAVGDTTIFTVPAKHTFFMTSAWVSSMSLAVGAGGTPANGLVDGQGRFLLAVFLSTVDRYSGELAASYPMPLKFEEGAIFRLRNSDIDKRTVGGFEGFLVPKRISKSNF